MNISKLDKLELLAPAGDYETLSAGINAGADAVYFGIKWLNMRAGSARNFDIDDLPKIMAICHVKGVKGYLTVNTVLMDPELPKVKTILEAAQAARVDAIIATDFAAINMCRELNLPVHVSTQSSVSNFEAVKFFSQFSSRIVLARECSLQQIEQMSTSITEAGLNVELECFVHGALCVAVSGRCFMSQFQNRLSANRGLCNQECRKSYKIVDVEDPSREYVLDNNFVMSPKDLCTLPILDKLVAAGITVFKIEGRARSPEYVHTVTRNYKEALVLIKAGEFTSKKALEMTQELYRVFNRGFTTNFYLGTPSNDSWSKVYGSKATERKQGLGQVTNFYSKLSVAAIQIEQNSLKSGDEVIITGNATGYHRQKVTEIRLDDQVIDVASAGQEISFATDVLVRRNDRVFIIEKTGVGKDVGYYEELAKIGIRGTN